MKKTGMITRRDFLRGTAGVVLGAAITPVLPHSAKAQARSKVVLIRDERVLGPDGDIQAGVLQAMLDEAVRLVADQKTPMDGWKSLFKKDDRVGIKTNAWRHLSTPKEMEQALKRRIMDAGVAEALIGIDDRGVRTNPLFVDATALVNVRPVRTHHWSGVGTCLKNYIMFTPVPSEYHPDGCADLGKIWTLAPVKGKTRLNILVALTPQFYGRGANFFDRRYVWPYKGIIVGTDPVAVDAIGAELLRRKRVAHFGEDRSLDTAPVHITVADKKYKLGTSDLNKIELVKTGWKEEVLL
ncbi:MAG TPA: DUF362 domain-containing protein [Syntrophorhabdaceae bacterium]|jgi:hypothetical protein